MWQSGWPPSISPCKKNPPENSVGVVIPLRDGLKFFRLAFYSVLYFTDYPYMLNVIDNRSMPRTRNYLNTLGKNHDISILQYDAPFNYSAEVNLGIRYLFSFPAVKYGLILNADAIVEPHWLSKMIRIMNEDPKIGMVGPVSNVATEFQTSFRRAGRFPVPYLSGLCMLFRRDVFEGVDGFDEEFIGGCFEDWDFCERAKKKGWNCVVDGNVYVHHYHRAYRGRQESNDALTLANRDRFFNKHPELKKEAIQV